MLALSTHVLRPCCALVFDPITVKIQGRQQEFFLRDALAQTAAYAGAIPDGIKAGAYMLWNGFDLQDAEELDMPFRYELPGGLAMNWPTRLLAGATAMFKTTHYKAAMAGLSMRNALRDGYTGQAAGARAAELLANPPADLVDQAWKEARDLAFVGPPGDFTRRFLRLRDTPIPEGYPGRWTPAAEICRAIREHRREHRQASYSNTPLAGAPRFAGKGRARRPEGSTVLAQAFARIGSMVMAAPRGQQRTI